MCFMCVDAVMDKSCAAVIVEIQGYVSVSCVWMLS